MKAAILELVLHKFASMGSTRITSQAGISRWLNGALFLNNRALKVLNCRLIFALMSVLQQCFSSQGQPYLLAMCFKKEGVDLERYCEISLRPSVPDFRCCCITAKRTATKETNSQTMKIFTEIPGTSLQISFQTSQPRERPFLHISLLSNCINWTQASRT